MDPSPPTAIPTGIRLTEPRLSDPRRCASTGAGLVEEGERCSSPPRGSPGVRPRTRGSCPPIPSARGRGPFLPAVEIPWPPASSFRKLCGSQCYFLQDRVRSPRLLSRYKSQPRLQHVVSILHTDSLTTVILIVLYVRPAIPIASFLSLLRKACSAEFLPEAAGRARVSGRDAAFAG